MNTQSTDQNLCEGEGTVAPAYEAMPSEATVFNYPGNPDLTPCSRLHCTRCGCDVRWLDRARFEGRSKHLDALYNLEDLGSSPSVAHPVDTVRLYLCRCDRLNCTVSMGLFLRDELMQSELPRFWTCGGHPPLALPATIGGVNLPVDVAWHALVVHTFRQPVDPDDPHRWPLWMEQVYGRLTGTPHQRAIDLAIADLLVSDDAVLCSRAIRFLWSALRVPAADRLPGLIDRLGNNAESRRDPFGDGDLYQTALHALVFHVDRGRWPYAEPITNWVRTQAAQPGSLGALVWFLASHDREWLLENLPSLLEQSPEAAEDVGLFVPQWDPQ